MSQVTNYTIENASAAAVRSDINTTLDAVKTMNSGSSQPSNPANGMLWFDTSGTPSIKIYNSGWLVVGQVTATAVDKVLTNLTAATASGFVFKNSSGTSRFTISDAGALACDGAIVAGGNITAYSDSRLKENVETLDGSKVLGMRGVSFTKDGEQSAGVIAQEIEKVAPELVDDSNEYLSVAYGNISGYLIEAVKMLQAQIDEQAETIRQLQEKIDT